MSFKFVLMNLKESSSIITGSQEVVSSNLIFSTSVKWGLLS